MLIFNLQLVKYAMCYVTKIIYKNYINFDFYVWIIKYWIRLKVCYMKGCIYVTSRVTSGKYKC